MVENKQHCIIVSYSEGDTMQMDLRVYEGRDCIG